MELVSGRDLVVRLARILACSVGLELGRVEGCSVALLMVGGLVERLLRRIWEDQE